MKNRNEVYFIADLHLAHENMAVHRGFENAAHMFEYIKLQWNSKVRKGDIVYILGDLTMEKRGPLELLDELNGTKIVILGNHDRPQDTPFILKHCIKVSGMMSYKGMILTHCPIHPMELKGRFSKNIHGHIHEKAVKKKLFGIFPVVDKRDVCVSCEHADYTPKSLEELGIDYKKK